MVVGYMLIGSLAGMLAGALSLVFGASIWLALGLYALVGAAATTLLALTHLLVGVADQAKASQTAEAESSPGEASVLERTADRPLPARASMKILAVDDDPFILELIPMISAQAGFSDVTPVASGEEALALLGQGWSQYDCLLFDISMPGMDGIELCRRVRQMPEHRQTPVIMLTALRDIRHMADAYRAGATDYTTKPFDIEELGTRLRMAQKTVEARREADLTTRENSEYRPRIAISDHIRELRNVAGEHLVDPAALRSYLTQVPRKELANVQVFAARLDSIDALHARLAPERFAALLRHCASAVIEGFGADDTVMAYSDDATLLVAINAVTPLAAITLERAIARRLADDLSGPGPGHVTGLSVGGPVRPQGSKAERAKMAIDRVCALLESRALEKQGGHAARLLKG